MKIVRSDKKILKATDFNFFCKLYLLGISLYVLDFFSLPYQRSETVEDYTVKIVSAIILVAFMLPRRIVTVEKTLNTFELTKNFFLFRIKKRYALTEIDSIDTRVRSVLMSSSDQGLISSPKIFATVFLHLKDGSRIKISDGWGRRNYLVILAARQLAKFMGVTCHRPVEPEGVFGE